MSDSLKQKIRAARPSLREISPVSYWFIFLMGIFNLIIGAGFILTLRDAIEDPAFAIIAQLVPFWLWGVLFIILGLFKLAALKLNNWKWARYTLLMGVSLKTGWAIALVLRTFSAPDNVFLTMTWLTIALTQIICYIYYLPPQEMRLFNGKKMDA